MLAPIGVPYVFPPDSPAARRFGSTFEVSSLLSSVVVSTPASARVDTTGLSTMRTSAELSCCAASSALLARSLVSNAVRLTFTPALVPQSSSSFAQAELLSNWGYGSQMVYVPLSSAFAPAAPEPEEQAVPTTATTVVRAAAVRRRRLEKLFIVSSSDSGMRVPRARVAESGLAELRRCFERSAE